MKVLIENEAGSRSKSTYDERSLRHVKTEAVSAAYPFPYGFVVGTVSGDGDAVDCFVLTGERLAAGMTVECEAIALLEQVEDGAIDHKVIAAPAGGETAVSDDALAAIKAFIGGVFAHVPGKRMTIGRLLPREAALDFIARATPSP
jgi:inorganic pyrophosphatase